MAKKIEISSEKLFELTHRLDFFNTMTDSQRRDIIKYLNGDLFVYDAGEAIINEGSTDCDLYIIFSGNVSVKKGQDEFRAIGALASGDFFGEISFMTSEKRISSVLAQEETILLHLSQEKFCHLDIAIQVLVKDKVILKLITRLDKMNRRVLKLRNI